MEKKIRMADIANALDVSVVSVSKALSGQSGVSRETREKILELSQKLTILPDVSIKTTFARGDFSAPEGGTP